jgi:hypothetical protein
MPQIATNTASTVLRLIYSFVSLLPSTAGVRAEIAALRRSLNKEIPQNNCALNVWNALTKQTKAAGSSSQKDQRS